MYAPFQENGHDVSGNGFRWFDELPETDGPFGLPARHLGEANRSTPLNEAVLPRDFTMMLWLRRPPVTGPQQRRIFHLGSAPAPIVELLLEPDRGEFLLRIFRPEDGRGADCGGPATAVGVRGDDGAWHHAAVTRHGDALTVFIDGQAVHSKDISACGFDAGDGDRLTLNGGGDFGFGGDFADVVLLQRALSPGDLELYVHGRRPWGEVRVPGAQRDFDDVRVRDGGDPYIWEIIGARPLADPPTSPPTNVEAYFNFADGVTINHAFEGAQPGVPGPQIRAARGRFGEPNGALRIDQAPVGTGVTTDFVFDSLGGSFVIEAWARLEAPGAVFGYADPGQSGSVQLIVGANDVQVTLVDRLGSAARHEVDGTDLVDGRWHHYALVYDNTVPHSRVVIDGVQRSVSGARLVAMNTNDLPLVVGGTSVAVGQFGPSMVGEIDEVAVHVGLREAPEARRLTDGYLRGRAEPLPRVRIPGRATLDPATGRYTMDYSLHWGDATIPPNPEPFAVAPTSTHFGWWRFDDFGPHYVGESAAANVAGGFLEDAIVADVGAGAGRARLAEGAGRTSRRFRLEANEQVTVECAARLSADDGEAGHCTGMLNDAMLTLGVENGRLPRAIIRDDDGTELRLVGGPEAELLPDQWYTLAVVRSGDVWTLYVDHVVVVSGAQAMGTFADPNGSTWGVGARFNQGNGTTQVPFSGDLGEVRVQKAALEPSGMLPLRHSAVDGWRAPNGLVWQTRAPRRLPHDRAVAYCRGLDGLHRAWRLPSIDELGSLHAAGGGCWDQALFGPCPTIPLFSSGELTNHPDNPRRLWNYAAGDPIDSALATPFYARCVSDGCQPGYEATAGSAACARPAVEVCNALDDDGDGAVDEGADPSAYWSFDQGPPFADAVDDRVLRAVGNAASEPGRVCGAVQTDEAAHLEGPEAAVTPGLGDFSVETWIQVREGESGWPVGVGGVTEDFGWGLRVGDGNDDAQGHLTFVLGISMDGGLGVGTCFPIDDGEWHHVAATADRDGALRLYLDGAPVVSPCYHLFGGAQWRSGEGDISYLENHDIQPACRLCVGASCRDRGPGACGVRDVFSGAVDELAFYERVLEPYEVRDHATAPPDACRRAVQLCDPP